jgi:hypothetical protein
MSPPDQSGDRHSGGRRVSPDAAREPPPKGLLHVEALYGGSA